jgi:hypothetical protein
MPKAALAELQSATEKAFSKWPMYTYFLADRMAALFVAQEDPYTRGFGKLRRENPQIDFGAEIKQDVSLGRPRSATCRLRQRRSVVQRIHAVARCMSTCPSCAELPDHASDALSQPCICASISNLFPDFPWTCGWHILGYFIDH